MHHLGDWNMAPPMLIHYALLYHLDQIGTQRWGFPAKSQDLEHIDQPRTDKECYVNP